jgi:hypothetical protein
MTHFIRAYLRASTNEQDAQRARAVLLIALRTNMVLSFVIIMLKTNQALI